MQGALECLNIGGIHYYVHRGRKLTQDQARQVLEYGIKKGCKTLDDLSDEEVDNALGWHICYKTNKLCKYDCKGLCRESY